jgi:hypothetical protein
MASRDPEGLDQVLRMENGNIRTDPPPSDLKKFKNTSLIYAKVISMSISIKSITLGPIYPTLVPAMLSFVRQILSLEQVYVWQGAVLDLAIAYHQDMMYSGITDITRWSYIPPDWITLYITPAKLKSTPLLAGPWSGPRGSKRKDPQSTLESSGGPRVPNTSISVETGTISITSATTLARIGDGMNAKSVVGPILRTNARNRGARGAQLLSLFRQIGH